MFNKNLRSLLTFLKKDRLAITVSAFLGLAVVIGTSNGDFKGNTVTAQAVDATVLADNDVRNSLSMNTIPSEDDLLKVESEHIVLQAKETTLSTQGYDDLVSSAEDVEEDYSEYLQEKKKAEEEAKKKAEKEAKKKAENEAKKKAEKEAKKKAEKEAKKKAEEEAKKKAEEEAKKKAEAEAKKKAEEEAKKKAEEDKKVEKVKEETVTDENGNTATFEVTGYCTCRICCGNYSPEVTGRTSHTASGTVPCAGRTVSVDPRVIPLGSTVCINGHNYIAEDTGSAVKGNIIDMYFDSHQEALNWGRQRLEVTWY